MLFLFDNLIKIKYIYIMKELKRKIKDSGFKQKHIAEKVGVSEAHLTMMLNEKAVMPELVRNNINLLLSKVLT